MKKQDNWMKTHVRQVHMDFHMPEFPKQAIKNFNAKKFVKNLVDGKINMVALFAKCHFGNSFYNTEIGHKHEGLKNDFLREAAEECRKNDIRTIAYYSLCCDRYAYEHYPHWAAVDDQGMPLPIIGPWGRVCINTPYREELVLPQLEEITTDYPVDGYFIDIPFVPQCYCEYCKQKFRLMYGKELTPDIPEIERKAFIQNSCGRFLKELQLIRDTYNPSLKILTNASWRLDTARTFSEMSDVGVWESQPHSNYLSHSFAVRSIRTLDVPVQVMSVRFYQGWGDLTLKPAAQMTTEFAAMTGNGNVASSGDQVNVDGTLQPAVYKMFKQSFGFVQEREKILRNAESVKETAILAPVPRKDFPPAHANGPAMFGTHKALLECHRQFDILNSLDIEKIKDYRYLVLPGPCDYALEVFPILRKWVKAGGTLIATGDALITNENNFELADVFGLEYLEPSVFSVSHFIPHKDVKGATADLPLQCRGRSYKVIPVKAKVLADYIYPQIESTDTYAFRHHICPPAADSVSPYPFTTFSTYGKGRAVYIAGSIFQIYWETNHHWLRQFTEGILNYLDPNPLYRIDCSGILEANLMKTVNRDLLLNLIHYQVGHQGAKDAIPSIETVYPLCNIDCEVKVSKPKKVILEPEGKELKFKSRNGYVCFTVPSIKYMAMVRIVT